MKAADFEEATIRSRNSTTRGLTCVYCGKRFVLGQRMVEIVTRAKFRLVPVHGYGCADKLRQEIG